MDLSKDGKLLWIYLIAKCNHAGMIELNEKLCKFQTDIKSMPTVIKELGNRMVTVEQGLYFLPKFIKFQYPNFPNSNVMQQKSAIEILEKYGLFSNGCLRVTQHLPKGYVNGIDNDSVNEHVIVNEKNVEKTEIIFPFDSDNFKQQWKYWIDYKNEEFKFKYKSNKTQQASLNLLVEMSGGDEHDAIKIIHYTMANGWKGFVKQKTNNGIQTREDRWAAAAADLDKDIQSKSGNAV